MSKYSKQLLLEKFSKIKYKSQEVYFEEFLKYLSEITLVVIEDTGHYAKEKVSIEEEEVIKKYIKRLNLEDNVYKAREEISHFFNIVLEEMLKDVIKIYSLSDRDQALIGLYHFKEMNTLLTFQTLMVVYDEPETVRRHDLIVLQDTLKYLRNCSKECFEKVFKNLELNLSKDKMGIEVLMETLIDNKENSISNLEMSEPNLINLKLLEYIKGIGHLSMLKDLTIAGHLEESTISVNKNGDLIYQIKDKILEVSDTFQEKNIAWLESKKANPFIVDEKFVNRINRVLKGEWKFDEKDLIKLIDGITIIKDAQWIICSYDYLKEDLMAKAECDEETMEAILEKLVRQEEKYEVKKFLDSDRNSRISRKCIIKLSDEYYIYSDTVLLECLGYIRKDIYDRRNLSDSLMSKLSEIFNDIDTEFEVKIKERIESFLDIKVIHSFDKLKGTNIQPPGEIDLIFIYDTTVYIVECKNFPFKSNLIAIRNEINKVNNKFSQKLQSKLEFVSEHLVRVLDDELGIKDIKKEDYTIEGLFITNAFSFVSVMKESPYKIINSTEVENFLSMKFLH